MSESVLGIQSTEVNISHVKVRAAELKGVDCAVCEVSWKRLSYISMPQLAMKWMCCTSSGCSVRI